MRPIHQLLLVVAILGLTSYGRPASLSAAGQTAPAAENLVRTRAVGSVSELMSRIIYPTSNAIFYIETRTPANETEWNELQGKALTLAESANLLMMPGRARDQDRWMTDATLMRDAGAAALVAAKKKDVMALAGLNEQLYRSCTTCHEHYRSAYRPRP